MYVHMYYTFKTKIKPSLFCLREDKIGILSYTCMHCNVHACTRLCMSFWSLAVWRCTYFLMSSEINVKVDGAIVAQNWQLVFNTWQLFVIDPKCTNVYVQCTHILSVQSL